MQVSGRKELGRTIPIDACHWKRNRDGREAIIVNIIDEASRFHVVLILKEGDGLGILTTTDYIEAVRMNRFRFARAPAVFRADCEARSNLMSFESCVQLEALKFKWRQARHSGKLKMLRLISGF